MTREALECAKRCVACIESAKNNIKSFERICEAGGDEIVICTKERLDGGHGNVNPIYLSGDMLEAIKSAYVEHWQKFTDKSDRIVIVGAATSAKNLEVFLALLSAREDYI